MRVNAFDKSTPRGVTSCYTAWGGSRFKWRLLRRYPYSDDCLIYADVTRRRMPIQPTSPSPASIMA
jgi:hypothetical protein